MAGPHRIGNYQIVRELGRGGMGVVYEGVHPSLERKVAIKVLYSIQVTPESLARFQREGELLARLRHPGVLRVHELGSSPQGPYLVTELQEGEDLDAVLRRGPLPPRRAAEITGAIADALAALHAAGIVHRDLKPHNVMLRPDGSPVLLDFGLARDMSAEKLTQTGALIGTPAYMAPEQVEGAQQEVDPRTDVYGLGAILFALLTGGPPFTGPTTQVLKQVLVDTPRMPSADRADVPAGLETILRRAMAKAIDERHPSMGALAEDLRGFLAGGGAEIGSSRLPLFAGLAACVLLVLGGVGWIATRPDAPPSDDPPPPIVEPPPRDLPKHDDPEPPRFKDRYRAEDWVELAPGARRGQYFGTLTTAFVDDERVLCLWGNNPRVEVRRLDGAVDRSFRYPAGWYSRGLFLPQAPPMADTRVGVETVALESATPATAVLLALSHGRLAGRFVFEQEALQPLTFEFPRGADGEEIPLAIPLRAQLGPGGRAVVGDHAGWLLSYAVEGERARLLAQVRHSETNPVGQVAVDWERGRVFASGGQPRDLHTGSERLAYELGRYELDGLKPVGEARALSLEVTALAPLADGARLLAGTRDHCLFVVPLDDTGLGAETALEGSGARQRNPGFQSSPAAHISPPRAFAVVRGDRLVSISGYHDEPDLGIPGELRCWNLQTLEEVERWIEPPRTGVHWTSLDRSPDGTHLVLGTWDGAAWLLPLIAD